ncbi:hypothetical protein PO883_18765 [Massilia sp. DJPM01]|uniref:hypothetical protein n=1 Tax=Massilia sp. DJPM01 TaxID=3024404 RepID=UPI00259ED810|nr:hypothetical protein [Massilia sp. DJPM01]MDM5179240.1 hypothetical protein [Massilia sp. DJPM01]
MGADIHLVVEACDTGQFVHPRGIAYFNWPRRTALFAAMTSLYGRACLIPARGFPEPASSMAYWHFGLAVIDDGDLDAALAMPSIPRSEAELALLEGSSQPLNFLNDFISAPHYAYCSWLTLPEFRNALANKNIVESDLSLECLSTMDMMANIEARGFHSRMVFWFDV